jgi:hypothetical protein
MTPQKRDRLRPWEFLGPAALIAIVIGVIVFFSVRRWDTAGIWAGIAFIVCIVVFATLILTSDPQRNRTDDERPDGHD